jgi:hypothetical protein
LAAERTVLTAIAIGAPPAVLAELLIAAETDRVFADGGHSIDCLFFGIQTFVFRRREA